MLSNQFESLLLQSHRNVLSVAEGTTVYGKFSNRRSEQNCQANIDALTEAKSPQLTATPRNSKNKGF